MSPILALLAELPDPRASNARHSLLDVVFIALLAVLCGAESCADMAEFGRAKHSLLQSLLKMPHGVPSHDTFSRVFRLLDPGAFEAAFARFTRAFAGALDGVVALDGKALRGAYLRGRRNNPLHLVNVWAAEARLALGQQVAPGRNEVAGALRALTLLRLDGCLVTADALYCRPDMAGAIRARGGQYVLAVKNNQPRLRAEALARLEGADPSASFTREARAHGRRELRRARVMAVPGLAARCGLAGAVALGCLESRRQAGDGPETVVVRHFVLSRLLSAEELMRTVRMHWTIENQLHWVLDVVMAEDGARTRKGHGPHNLALLRKLALNMLRAHPDPASLRRKVKRAGWDDTFLLSLIAHMR
jgi:predicted transposase YbfD/YdcC